MRLRLEYVGSEQARAGWSDALGAAVFGADPLRAPIPPEVPHTAVRMPVLAGPQCWIERWHSGEPPHYSRIGAVRLACTGALVFGALSAEEPGEPPAAVSALEAATEWAYGQIHAALAASGCRHLVRIWNYLPHINAECGGLERYRQFNGARRRALLASGQLVSGPVPAASALGCGPGPLSIYFLAARQAPRFIENPRQVSAYHYPRQYGQRAPIFSRATLIEAAHGARLFISGTSSIVGHRTLHAGDPAAQTRETLTNIEALLAQAPPFTLEDLTYKIYVRNPPDLPLVQREIDAALGPRPPRVYLQADVCRADLAVEIEASGGRGES
jgi:chorismate lyase/3-hydroxybenzoate synthase